MPTTHSTTTRRPVERDKDYVVRARWFAPHPEGNGPHALTPEETPGWHEHLETLIGFTYAEAAEEASKKARQLDAKWGDWTQWSVYLNTPEGSSYYEFFHGRTS